MKTAHKVIALIGAGHFFSHFYLLLLPPLFPVLRDVYGVGFTELGLAITAFSVTTALTQAPVGFAVDRYGPQTILVVGLVVESLAFAAIGIFPSYAALITLMVIAGLANAVYHPADYAILNAAVDTSRIGRAFSIHTFAGLLGGALAPASMIALMSFMDWRSALMICGCVGLAVAWLLRNNAHLLAVATPEARGMQSGTRDGVRFLFTLPILLGVLFFVGISMSSHGIGSFSVSALHEIYDAPLETLAGVLSAYLFAAPIGVLVGGRIADHTVHHARVAAASFVIVAIMLFCIAAFRLPILAVGALLAVAGLFSGIVAPSRDMLIRAVTPPGAMGKTFGFVSTGFNVGGIIAPLVFGFCLDHANPRVVFLLIGIISLLTVATVLATGREGRRHTALSQAASS